MTKGITTEEFIKRAKEVHGDTYDYSETIYKDRHLKVKIICKTHGLFEQCAKSHIYGSGCRECGFKKQGKNRKLTTEDFINRMISTYGENKFDFTLTKYNSAKENIRFKCIKHNNIISKQALSCFDKFMDPCNICHRENVPLVEIKTTEEFIQEAIKVHGENRYNYDKVIYEKKSGKVTIICNECQNEFKQAVHCHLDKNGCPICARKNTSIKNKSNTETFIEKAIKIHGNLYDYSLVEYKGVNGTVKIICKKEGHGVFEQSCGHHLQNQGCKKCAIEKYSGTNKLSHDEFIKKALEVHGDKYDYSITKYINSDTNIDVICKKNNHGIFTIRPDGFLDKGGCKLCVNKSEGKIYDELIKKYNIQKQFRPKWCKNETTNKHLPFDFVIEEYNIIIEIDGEQHFRQVRNWLPPDEIHKRDIYKMKCANNNSYSIIRIYQPDVYSNKYDWVSELVNSIESIKESKCVENHFISSNNVYDIFD
jgi:very-short-patch-repair endonuclease